METLKNCRKRFCALLAALLLLVSSFSLVGANSAYIQSAENSDMLVPDTLIRGIVSDIQYNYQGSFLGGTYKLTALINVKLNETIKKPESFTRERNQLVAISYNYSTPPECKVNDVIEVHGLWISVLDVPASLTIRVDDDVTGSYVDVMGLPPSIPPSGDNWQNNQNVSSVNTQAEYLNGSISLGPDMNIWYTWINASSTQVIFFTYYSMVYNSPIQTFLGQHYMAANETEVFIGNKLMLMEAYNDTNGNGIPDVNFEMGIGEIRYFFLVNSSETFTVKPIQKIVIENVSHYVWGIEYGWVDGFLLYPGDRTNVNAYSVGSRVNITELAFTYEYYVQGNVSYLKTGFKIGEIVDFEPWVSDVSLDGLGLSLLYGTTILTSRPYTVHVNGEPYNSTTAEASKSTSRTEVIVEDTKLYEFIFEENYTLYRNSVREIFESKSAASPTESIPPNAANYLSPYWLVDWLLRFLSEEIFQKLSSSLPDVSLQYENSSFVYRVCYPTWEGWGIEHDPTYVAYLVPVEAGPPPINPPTGPSIEIIATVAIAVAGLFALSIALIELRRLPHFMKINPVTK